MELFGPILLQLAVNTPLYLAWLVGIVFALIRWRASLRFRLVGIALVVFLLVGLAATVMNTVLPITLMREGLGAARLGLVLSVVNVVHTLVSTAGWVLILVALFWQPRPVAGAPLAAPTDLPGD